MFRLASGVGGPLARGSPGLNNQDSILHTPRMWSFDPPDEPGRYWFKGMFELVDGQPQDMLDVVIVDTVGMVTLPGLPASFPLKRFIGEWSGPLFPPDSSETLAAE